MVFHAVSSRSYVSYSVRSTDARSCTQLEFGLSGFVMSVIRLATLLRLKAFDPALLYSILLKVLIA